MSASPKGAIDMYIKGKNNNFYCLAEPRLSDSSIGHISLNDTLYGILIKGDLNNEAGQKRFERFKEQFVGNPRNKDLCIIVVTKGSIESIIECFKQEKENNEQLDYTPTAIQTTLEHPLQ